MDRSSAARGHVPAIYARRREAILRGLGAAVMVLPSAPIQYRSRDTEYRYRPDSELYYSTGVTAPGAVAVLRGGDSPDFTLFVRPRDAEAELWSGERLGVERASELYGPDACHSLAELDSRLPELLDSGKRVFYRARANDGVGGLVADAISRARARGPRTGTGPRGTVDPGEILDELRLLKDENEVACIREAVAVSIEGQRAAAGAIGPGVAERTVEAAVEGAFRREGASGPGFPTIVGAGQNACVLHYVDNSSEIEAGALVLVDAGAEVGLYNGDITRTYPASGTFSEDQRAIYDLVDAARQAAVEAVRPGVSIASVHDAALRVIVEGLIDLGVLVGDVETLSADGAHRAFFPHQTSHWLGIDVHDPGDYAVDGESRVLQPGMVFTVEPGLYFRPGMCTGGAARFSGIGVRIEDDVLVTEGGCEVLTAALPTAAAEIEALMGPGS